MPYFGVKLSCVCLMFVLCLLIEKIAYSYPKVTYSYLWVTYIDPKVTYSDPKVTPSDPIHLPLPPPTSPGQVLLFSVMRLTVVATNFNLNSRQRHKQ